jgi:glycosyltransferase involved in cell wall biosynthesis
MRILTNVTRELLGGITRSNVSFINFLKKTNGEIVGLELNSRRYTKSATIFSHLPSDWFDHHIINIHDISIYEMIKKSKNLKDLENKYKPIIKIIKDILEKTKPDVVFLNGTYYIPWLISIAAHELKIPIVLRYAGIYTKETANAKPKAKKFFNEIEKSFQKRTHAFVFPSQLCRNVVEEEIIKKKIKNSFVIFNPFNIPEDEKTFKTVERRIASVGRWDPIKNFDVFFKIHKELLKDKWIHEATLITNDIKTNKIPRTIKRMASMNHDELLKFYTSQGLIISPSIFETFGNVPIEAVCMGIPVLISENMGCSEVLKMAGLENMVISFNNIKEVSERVKKLCGQQILPKQINNLRKILNPEVINAEIMSVIRDTVERTKK